MTDHIIIHSQLFLPLSTKDCNNSVFLRNSKAFASYKEISRIPSELLENLELIRVFHYTSL